MVDIDKISNLSNVYIYLEGINNSDVIRPTITKYGFNKEVTICHKSVPLILAALPHVESVAEEHPQLRLTW